ncbi:hypothetical protein ITJ54_03300 [Curtobacterium sp. VKM Ac-2865]|uniref:hypothetical protein n=1 Tax=Curtobacterium sp. VKM Ac-2865 TaxID=2783817 RepID=UPI00188A160E|nr:hypothetical protein [Curtobacterium sp. VKM Ac-2865]MBF4581689.1 hypothetical protein [Curtobacterium sp. VKM Ac-2865]
MSPDTDSTSGADTDGTTGADTDGTTAWEAVLTSLEQATVDGDPAPWHEPTGLGPMPRALAGRASRLLAAQRDRMATLEGDRRQALEHLGALRQVDATRAPQRSVYLDASA